MNVLFNQNNSHIANINTSQTKEKNQNHLAVFSNLESNKNRYFSENQRNLTKFNSQKKIKKKEINSKNITHNDNKPNILLVDNNILKNYTNLIARNNKNKKYNNKSHCLSKPKLEIEINNINSNNISKNFSKNSGNKKYKKNISEHDLINNLLTSFTNYNMTKGINNMNINFSSKKKLSYDKNKNKTRTKRENTLDNKAKQNKSDKNMARTRHASDTKLLRSSSGYSYINNFAQTNSFLNGNNSNHLGYISTWGNSPNMTNSNFANMVKTTTKKNSYNKNKNKNKKNSSKGPLIGKIIKNYKNNDLNCIFNMNLIPPVSPINNIQDYFKNLYKIEYNSEYRVHKNKNSGEYKKENHNNLKRNKDKDKDKETKTKSNNDDYSQSKITMTKTNESKLKKEKDSIDNMKYCISDTPEEIHFYIINSVKNGKNMILKLNKK